MAEVARAAKPFKAAYNDLKAMSKGALARDEKAVELAKKTIAAEKQQFPRGEGGIRGSPEQ